MVASVLLDPNQFFRKRTEDMSSLPPAIILCLAGLSSLLTFVLAVLVGAGMDSGIAKVGLVLVTVAFNAPIQVFTTLIMCGFLGGILHLTCLAAGGVGTIGSTLKVTAWGFLPKVIAGLIQPVVWLLVTGGTFDQETVSSVGGLGGLVAGQAASITAAVSALFLLWQAVIWLSGIQYTHRLSRTKAGLAVAVPVALTVTVQLAWSLAL
ncbi:Yip1 family protein [Haloarchaeobius sp. DFWS5]|uniref:Yip1 family protein n=1 Tax=Haloarchaeobius sp. DFWS5 TaxID=3446114 RepID=UPI003EBE8854